MSVLRILTFAFLALMWAGLLYVLVVEPIRIWLRHRKAQPVPPSPIRSYYNGRGIRVRRALARESIFTTDHEGRERIGL